MPQTLKPKDLKDGLEVASLKEVGINSRTVQTILEGIKTGHYANRHSLLIYKNHKLVLEKYFTGEDEIWGHSIGKVENGRDVLHDVRSISKSVTSACVGIAFAQGYILDIHQSIFDFFPEYLHFKSEGREYLTIEHLLCMTVGLEWDEETPYSNPHNSQIMMDRSADPIGYFLSRPLIAAPGTSWCYNGGTTEILAQIVTRVSGLSIYDFAKKFLFFPLGITHTSWTEIKPGMPSASAGLRMRSRDMLKFGILYINNGFYNGIQVIPEFWVKQSLSAKIKRQGLWSNGHYGYQFWIFNETIHGKKISISAALGSGDQCIYIDKKSQLIVVSTAGNYPPQSPEKRAFDILKEMYHAIWLHKKSLSSKKTNIITK